MTEVTAWCDVIQPCQNIHRELCCITHYQHYGESILIFPKNWNMTQKPSCSSCTCRLYNLIKIYISTLYILLSSALLECAVALETKFSTSITRLEQELLWLCVLFKRLCRNVFVCWSVNDVILQGLRKVCYFISKSHFCKVNDEIMNPRGTLKLSYFLMFNPKSTALNWRIIKSCYTYIFCYNIFSGKIWMNCVHLQSIWSKILCSQHPLAAWGRLA